MNMLEDDDVSALAAKQIYRMARRVYHLAEEKPLAYQTWTTILAGDPNPHVDTPLHELPVCKAPNCNKVSNDTGDDLLVCSKCKTATYCSVVCQKK